MTGRLRQDRDRDRIHRKIPFLRRHIVEHVVNRHFRIIVDVVASHQQETMLVCRSPEIPRPTLRFHVTHHITNVVFNFSSIYRVRRLPWRTFTYAQHTLHNLLNTSGLLKRRTLVAINKTRPLITSLYPPIHRFPYIVTVFFHEHHMAVPMDTNLLKLHVSGSGATCRLQVLDCTIVVQHMVTNFARDGERRLRLQTDQVSRGWIFACKIKRIVVTSRAGTSCRMRSETGSLTGGE